MQRKHRSPIWGVSLDEFKEIINKSNSFTEALSYFGLKNKGSNHITLKNRCKEEGIDLSDLKTRSVNLQMKNMRSLRDYKKQNLSEILVINSTYSRTHLKPRLVAEGLLIEKCSKCGLGSEWYGEKLSLVLDHINGVPNDNRLVNLRFMCPNCNSQTLTFAGRQRRKYLDKEDRKKQLKENNFTGDCPICNGSLYGILKFCSTDCADISRRKCEWPSKEILENEFANMSMVQIGKKYGVSDKTVKKWARRYGII